MAVLAATWGQLRIEHLDATDLETFFPLRPLIQLLLVDSQLILVLPHHFLGRETHHRRFFEAVVNWTYMLHTLE